MFRLTSLALLACCTAIPAADLQVLPADVALNGPYASQQLVVVEAAGGEARIDREDPAKSLLLLKPTMVVTHGGGLKIEVDSPEYRILAEWIASGAPAPGKDDPVIRRLEVLPATAVLRPKDTLQMLVRAWYS